MTLAVETYISDDDNAYDRARQNKRPFWEQHTFSGRSLRRTL